jgi:hypothetical protein
MRHDRSLAALKPEAPRPTRLPRPAVFGPPEVVLLDLPQLDDQVPAHQPLVTAHARPWTGEMAVWRGTDGENGLALVNTLGSRSRLGRLAGDLHPGPTSRIDWPDAGAVVGAAPVGVRKDSGRCRRPQECSAQRE